MQNTMGEDPEESATYLRPKTIVWIKENIPITLQESTDNTSRVSAVSKFTYLHFHLGVLDFRKADESNSRTSSLNNYLHVNSVGDSK